MIRLSHLRSILLGFLLASCASLPSNAQLDAPSFIVITKNPDDQVEIQNDFVGTLVDIHSPSGIGSATFELESGAMPEIITLRLYLTGLEGFRLKSAQDEVSASVSSAGMKVEHQAILSSGTETPLQSGHPLWIKIDVVSETGTKVPLEQGYFEITVPEQFLHNAGKTFEIEWIDFYR